MADADRQERLIAALEAQATAINRLVQTLEHKRARKVQRTRQRVVQLPEKPITVTPLVEATVARALARNGHR